MCASPPEVKTQHSLYIFNIPTKVNKTIGLNRLTSTHEARRNFHLNFECFYELMVEGTPSHKSLTSRLGGAFNTHIPGNLGAS